MSAQSGDRIRSDPPNHLIVLIMVPRLPGSRMESSKKIGPEIFEWPKSALTRAIAITSDGFLNEEMLARLVLSTNSIFGIFESSSKPMIRSII